VDDAARRYLRQLIEMGETDLVLPEQQGREDRVQGQDGSHTARSAVVTRSEQPGGGRTGARAASAPTSGPPPVAPTPGPRPPAPVAAKGGAAGDVPAPASLPAGVVAEAPAGGDDLFAVDPLRQLATLEALVPVVEACRKCALGHSRQHSVPGEGDPSAGLVVVGEAPGANEDETGRPFVGRAGKLLDDILKAIGFHREAVFICNVLKCRPPGNRNPEPLEVAACSPYLHRQLELIGPKVILAMGRPAAHALLGVNAALAELRGKVHRYRGIPVIVTYHPAALLRNPHWKRPTWDDVRIARRIYDGDLA
jgi:uracil-DNA glycosylase family 4